jgi:hypothetical protein
MGIERLNPPDLRYSDWHRTLDRSLGMIDLDAVECCHRCWQPVALIELAAWGTRPKSVTTMTRLAEMSGLPAYTVRYQFPDPTPVKLAVRRHGSDDEPVVIGPGEFERFLLDLRNGHTCPRKER